MSNTRGDEWYTPEWLVKALGKFDLDPSAPRRNHWTADRCYTKRDNGLALPWFGRVFLNPPYSNPDPWVEKLVQHGNAIALYFARTDTRWMHRALDSADAVFFLKGRIPFVDIKGQKSGSPASPSILLAYGQENVAAIRRAAARNLIEGKLSCLENDAETVQRSCASHGDGEVPIRRQDTSLYGDIRHRPGAS